MITMTNLHHLSPCAICATRMAVPGSVLCTMCDAVTLPAMIANDVAELTSCPGPG